MGLPPSSHRPSNPVTMAAAAAAQLTSRRVLAGRSSKAIVTGLPSALSRAYATDAASGTSKTLVFLEHKDGKLNPGSLNALSAASALGGEIVGLVTGEGESASKVAEAAKKTAPQEHHPLSRPKDLTRPPRAAGPSDSRDCEVRLLHPPRRRAQCPGKERVPTSRRHSRRRPDQRRPEGHLW